MSNQKPTPGPWIVDLRTGCFAILKQTDKRTCLYGASDDAIVFQHGRGEESSPDAYRYLTDEQEANARLIAAAPELLEALEEANAYIEDTGAGGRYIDIREYVGKVRGVMAKINAAINKAKGADR